MKNTKPRLLLLLLLLAAVPFTQPWAAASEKGPLVASLVRSMGYGGGIHQFKNYVLRGDEKYREGAEESFAQADKTLADLRATGDLTAEELGVLDDIEAVIDAYRSNLPVVQRAYANETSLARILKQVDKEVKIDDTPAVDGIVLLRKSAGPWSPVEEIEYDMGYGGAIHNFKNYLIRQTDKYRERADSGFSVAANQAETLRNSDTLTEEQRDALKTLKQTIEAYRRALPRIQRTLAPAQSSDNETIVNIALRGADKAVKIKDDPAIAALAVLRAN